MGLVTLEEMKTYLQVDPSSTGDDEFLQMQIDLISDTVEAYCQRVFTFGTYVETFYPEDLKKSAIFTAIYPVKNILAIEGGEVSIQDYRVHKPSGRIFGIRSWGNFSWSSYPEVTVRYEAGYEVIPGPVKSAVFSLVSTRYNSRKAGVALDFGSDVQRVSIPGTISIDFDYSLTNNDEKSGFGSILGNQKNSLTAYCSDRAILGSEQYRHVEKV